MSIAPGDRWGPFADGLEPGERIGRLRTLVAVVHLLVGARGRELVLALREAERDAGALPAALDALARLEPLDRRRALASYAIITRPGG